MNRKKRMKCPDMSSTEGETMSSSEYEGPFVKKFPQLPGEEDLPSLRHDLSRAKAYLMKQCLSSGDNLWDHLSELLKKILIERPKDIACTFEEYSYKVKELRFKTKTDHLLDIYAPPLQYPYSEKLIKLLQLMGLNSADKAETEEEEEIIEHDLMKMFFYFEQGGVSLPKEEVFCIAVHIKNLANSHPIKKPRFWGKILGTHHNYYIAEAEFNDEELARVVAEKEEEWEKIKAEQQEKEAAEKEEKRLKREADMEEEKEKQAKWAATRTEMMFDRMLKEAKDKGMTKTPERMELSPWPPAALLPEAHSKKVAEIPPEPPGTGTNKKVYFVCLHPGEDWIQLPDVTPQQIIAARKIKRAFIGDLESDVVTFPAFPGKEKNYLRAQIARISSGTQISPLGYYTFNEEDEEEENEIELDEGGKRNYQVNPDYEPVAIRDLVDPSMAFWVHHTQYILEQGRTTWWNPPKEEANEEEGEAEEEEENEKEVGPELLTPLSEDSAMDAIVPWSVRKTSSVFPEDSVAVVRSNLWPGAFAYAADKKFDNVYIGYGLKFSGTNHSPIPLEAIQEEYPLGPEIMEIQDPTPEQEQEWRLAHEKKGTIGEEEEIDEPGDDADDEDDDDQL